LTIVVRKFSLAIFILFLSSCAGYQWTNKTNPFARYGIRKLCIPTFLNQSTLSGPSVSFTSEVMKMLNTFNNLEVQGGFSSDCDGVLIGKIKSSSTLAATVTNQEIRVAKTIADQSIGGVRGDFYVPAVTKIGLQVQFIVIKRPTEEELKFFLSNYADRIISGQKIVFNELISIEERFNREIFDGEATVVNATQNRGATKKSINQLALNAANTFRDMILYAF
jgi:hypothetical protein